MIVGIDVGGANTKVATSDASFIKSIYTPLWKNKAVLYKALSEVKHEMVVVAEKRVEERLNGMSLDVGAVMTGELCDCFNTKKEGVVYIKNCVDAIFGDIKFLDTACDFKDGVAVDENPLAFSSTNWLASAQFISKEYRDAILVDIGSTTTDVIPIVEGEVKAKRSDLERLKSGELIYSGVLRTNVSCLLTKVKIKGEEYRTSSELFAITADAYLTLGYITEGDYSCESPDGYTFEKEKRESVKKAMRRLARVVCSDLEEIGEEGAFSIAKQVKNAQINELIASMEQMKREYGLKKVISAGIGDFIGNKAATSLDMDFLPLSSLYGKEISAAFPAYSVAKLVEGNLTKHFK
jgi:hypothetical protein